MDYAAGGRPKATHLLRLKVRDGNNFQTYYFKMVKK